MKIELYNDTIAAISTAAGASGIGIVRISGQEAPAVAERVFKNKRGWKISERPTHTVTYGYIYDEKGLLVDEAIAVNMRGPHSFTGENVVELQCHGGMVVIRKVLELVLQAGARLAEPGEFSKRAFLNGRLDLSQAEAIMEIVNAKTEAGVYAAASGLLGAIAKQTKEIKEGILEIIAYLEADIDFPEEDLSRLSPELLAEQIKEVQEKLKKILSTYKSGRIVREGLKTAIVGKPNVGKSSLLNTILREKRAIVTDVPGTTRDVIEEYYNLGGIPLVLMDTAGIRKTDDIVERLGVERTKEAIKRADLILYLLDVAEGLTEEDLDNIRQLPEEKLLVVANKIDLLSGDLDERAIKTKLEGSRVLFISVKEQTGIEELVEGIRQMFFKKGWEPEQETLLTNARQKDALEKTLHSLRQAGESLKSGYPSEFIVIDLKQALLYLGEVTGDTLGEDVIDEIFSRFCLGK